MGYFNGQEEHQITIYEHIAQQYKDYYDKSEGSKMPACKEFGVSKELNQFVKDRMLTYLKKNADYGDSYINAINKFGDKITFQVVAQFKMDRIRNLIGQDHREIWEEDITQNVYDLFNYAVMTATCYNGNPFYDVVETAYMMAECSGCGFIDYLTEMQVSDSNDIKIWETIKTLFPE